MIDLLCIETADLIYALMRKVKPIEDQLSYSIYVYYQYIEASTFRTGRQFT